jgi:ABC-type nitrate/sulfonate/bicarbonate transport system substrate-binding protein
MTIHIHLHNEVRKESIMRKAIIKGRRAHLPLAVATVLALALSACGGDSDAASGDSGAIEQPDITIGTTTPGMSSPQLLLGIEAGIYKEHGLNVEQALGAGGAALIPPLVSGDQDVAFGNYVPFLQAVEQGIDLGLVAGGSHLTRGVHALFVRADSDIQSPADFEGKTLAVNTLRNVGELAYREAMEEAGVDPDSAQFTEIGFPDQAGALERGDIDVAWLPANFRKDAEARSDFRLLLDFDDIEAIKDLPNGGFISTRDWIDENPNTVKELRSAIADATDHVMANQDQVRAAYVTVGHLSEELSQQIALEEHDSQASEDGLQRLVELMVKWDFLEEPIDLEGFVAGSGSN